MRISGFETNRTLRAPADRLVQTRSVVESKKMKMKTKTSHSFKMRNFRTALSGPPHFEMQVRREKAMTENTLSGKIALVTGGGRGIGAAIAHTLAGLGPTVVICGRTLPALQGTAGNVRTAGGQCEAMVCDLTEWNSGAALAARGEPTFGRLDNLGNNA